MVYIHDLIEKGYLTDVADIFTLSQHREELIEQGIIGKEKNTDKLLGNIEKAKRNSPDRLLTGLGISNVGKSAAQVLMNHFGSFDALSHAQEEDLMAVDDIGPISAQCVYAYFREAHNQKVLQKLKDAGVNIGAGYCNASPGGPAPFRADRCHLWNTARYEPGRSHAADPEPRGKGNQQRLQKNCFLTGGGQCRQQIDQGRVLRHSSSQLIRAPGKTAGMRKEIRMFPGKHTDFSLILDFFSIGYILSIIEQSFNQW